MLFRSLLLETKDAGVKGLHIGILKEGISSTVLDPGVGAKFQAAAKVFEDLGAIVEEVSIPMHTIAPAIFGVVSKQGGAIGRVGRASGRRQVMLTDLYEKMLPCTAQTIEKVRLPAPIGT